MTAGTINFSTIKPHGGDQRHAFEEMCFQLFAKEFAAEGEPVRREGSGGDAGIEGYIASSEGVPIIGLQAKFFPNKFGGDQWRKIDESVRTALKDSGSDCMLKRIIVAIPRALNQTQDKKWNQLRAGWRQLSKKLGYRSPPQFRLWGSSSLESILKEEKNRGQLLYWFDFPNFDRGRCAQLSHATIAQLGDRYIPDLHTPTECEEKVHIFLRTERSRKAFFAETKEAIRHEHIDYLETEDKWPTEDRRQLAVCREKWRIFLQEFGDGISLPKSFNRLISGGKAYHEQRLKLAASLLRGLEKSPSQPVNQTGYRVATPLEKDYRSLTYNNAVFEDYIQRLEIAFELSGAAFLLVSGDAGSGKSHMLAEICNRYLDANGIVLFSEGGQFHSAEAAWNQLLNWADFNCGGVRDFLACFSALAATTSLPGLICVDALNETTHKNIWLKGLEKFAAEFQPFPNLKLLVSCRKDYLDLTVPDNVRHKKLVTWRHVSHEGLGLNVFEAVPKYLKAYRVKGVGITPLTPEFSRPLMLKTYCEAFKDKEPPPGSLSLPRILEAYVNRKSNNIASQTGCAASAVSSALCEIAARMLQDGSMRLSERDARNVALSHYPPAEESKGLYRALVAEGILAEFPITGNMGKSITVRFTFERMWDFFLSLYLMPIGSAPSRTLRANLDNARWRFEHRGVVEILSIRFPEEGHGEILDIAKAEQFGLHDLRQAFIRSLPWRTQKSCSKRTNHWFTLIYPQPTWTQALECIFPVLVNTENPWNAKWLDRKLRGMPILQRDREWTIWLNSQFRSNDDKKQAVQIIRLAETCDRALLSSDQLSLLATALGWMLTTSAVNQRNRISVALARILRNDLILALYTLDPRGRLLCLGGGTWIVKPNAARERLPWLVKDSKISSNANH